MGRDYVFCMISPIQKHRSCDCRNPYVFIWEKWHGQNPMFLMEKYKKHIVKHRRKTWSNIVEKHGQTSSKHMVNKHRKT
jgi:hypothetical protein